MKYSYIPVTLNLPESVGMFAVFAVCEAAEFLKHASAYGALKCFESALWISNFFA